MTRLISFLLPLLLFGNLCAQIQTDIEWPTLANSDWPMIKHDPQFTGRSPYKGPQTATIAWTVDMPNGIFSGPVIGEMGNLFFGSYFQLGEYFYSYSSGGSLIWIYNLGTKRAPQTGILIDSSNSIYFGSLDSCFYALYPDGTLKWKYKSSFSIVELAMPNIDFEGKLYFTNFEGELNSVNSDGILNWKVKYENGFFERSPVFSPEGNTIYIFGADSNLFALNLDGTLKWKYSFIGSAKAPIVDSDGNIYFDGPQKFYSIKPDGSIRWTFSEAFFGTFSMPTIDKNGNIYTLAFDTVTPFYMQLVSLDYHGNLRWKYIFTDDELDDFWQPLICDSEGTVYIGSTIGHYYYAITDKGELKWKLPLNGYQVDNTGAISEDGTLYIGVHKSSLWNGHEKSLIAIRDTNTTGIANEAIIKDYSLGQNYPNPFNPTTTIEYSLAEEGFVKIQVFNLLGKEISTLINSYKKPGNYKVEFIADHLTSGIY
ncbi:MAG: PQQ-binding-like beta-propeller repeat protein, partial [Ignavibacteriaceae bacterium]|nr:PQQ-binding-like beta-propeller repeat protein [Ignavibacteriaceae bacterium]